MIFFFDLLKEVGLTPTWRSFSSCLLLFISHDLIDINDLWLTRACQSSGPVSFKPPTSANQSRSRILRRSSTFSSSTIPPVENKSTSAFPPRVSFLLPIKSQTFGTVQLHNSVFTLLLFCLLQIKTHNRWVLPHITSTLIHGMMLNTISVS